MKYKLHRLPLGLTRALLCVLLGCAHQSQPPRASKGVLDLSNWDFSRDGPVDLSGEYEFYWEQLITPEDFSRLKPSLRHFMPVPDSWKGHNLDGHKLPGIGYATYRLTILLNRSAPRLALKFLDMGTAYKVFANGQPLLTIGTVGQTPATSAPRYFPQIVEVPIDSNRLELIYLVSNFHHNRGGAWELIRLGTREQLAAIRDRRLALDLIMFGSILSLGLYHLTLYGLRKNDRAALLFGIYCLLIAVRLLTTVERFLLHAFPEMNWEIFVKTEYLSFYPAVGIFALFIYRLFPHDIHRPALAAILAGSLAASVIVGLTPARIFTQTIFAFQIFTVAVLVYGLTILAICARRKREGAAIILFGFIFLAAAVVNDILNANEIIQTGHLVHLGLFVFIFSHAFILSSRYARAFKTIDRQRGELVEANAQLQSEIAERRQAEAALQLSEARYRALYDNNPSMYFTLDAQGSILAVNHFGAEQLGYAVNELVGRPVLDIFHPEDQPKVLQQLQLCLQNPAEVYHWEFRKVRKNGSMLWVKEHSRVIKNFQGAVVVLIVCEDITEHKAAEQALRESEKLAATGRMSARIAHEINNPLAAIKTAFHLIGRELPPENRYYHYLDKIDKDITRIAGIVYQMLELYSPEQKISSTFRLEAFLRGIIATLRVRQPIEIKLDNASAGSTVHLPEGRLRHILTTLIQNAIEVSPPEGKISINAAIEQHRLRISVIDQGRGIAAEDRKHIFEPFYTTKDGAANGSRLGLGLSVCKSLVEAMNGIIDFESQPGQGTEFRIVIPFEKNNLK
jgi:PAS domain S-box-containing protein